MGGSCRLSVLYAAKWCIHTLPMFFNKRICNLAYIKLGLFAGWNTHKVSSVLCISYR